MVSNSFGFLPEIISYGDKITIYSELNVLCTIGAKLAYVCHISPT